MFGLTKREQRWKAEQQAAELLVGLAQVVVRAAADVRMAESNAELERLRESQAPSEPKPVTGDEVQELLRDPCAAVGDYWGRVAERFNRRLGSSVSGVTTPNCQTKPSTDVDGSKTQPRVAP